MSLFSRFATPAVQRQIGRLQEDRRLLLARFNAREADLARVTQERDHSRSAYVELDRSSRQLLASLKAAHVARVAALEPELAEQRENAACAEAELDGANRVIDELRAQVDDLRARVQGHHLRERLWQQHLDQCGVAVAFPEEDAASRAADR